MRNSQQEKGIESKVDFLNKKFINNPFPVYNELRKEEPIYRLLMPNGEYAWIVTAYNDAEQLLMDSRFVTRDPAYDELLKSNLPSHTEIITRYNIFSVNAADHKRLRRLIQKAFTPKMVEQLRGRIEEITNDLLDQVQNNGEMNLIEDFAFPLPIKVICEMLGVPIEDQDKFRKWSDIITEGVNNSALNQENDDALIAFIDYLRELITIRRNSLKEDLISDLLRVEDDGDVLSENELYALVFVLIIAGHETTVNLIGNGVLALLEHPEQRRKLEEEPTLIKSAVEEMLRYNGPVEVSNVRWVTENVEFKEKQFNKGDMVLICLTSANRDDKQFSDPDVFDITRKANNHLAFGKGVHFCLGAPLARLEGEIAIRTLMHRLPNLHLKGNFDQLEWRSGMIIRGLKEIPLRF